MQSNNGRTGIIIQSVKERMDLPEFNLGLYASLLLSGCRTFVYRPMGAYALIRQADESPISCSEYELQAGDLQLMEMASGIDEFKIYYLDVLP